MNPSLKFLTVARVDRRVSEALDDICKETGTDRARAAKALGEVYEMSGGPITRWMIRKAVKRIKSLTG